MELTININDPKAYLKPWTITTTLNLLPDTPETRVGRVTSALADETISVITCSNDDMQYAAMAVAITPPSPVPRP